LFSLLNLVFAFDLTIVLCKLSQAIGMLLTFPYVYNLLLSPGYQINEMCVLIVSQPCVWKHKVVY